MMEFLELRVLNVVMFLKAQDVEKRVGRVSEAQKRTMRVVSATVLILKHKLCLAFAYSDLRTCLERGR